MTSRSCFNWTLLFLMFVGLACDRPPQHAASVSQPTDKVKIGVLLIGTGENAAYGQYTRQGIDLAIEALGPAREKIDLIYKDTKADPQEALRGFKELCAQGVPLVIGPFTSTEVRQVGPEAQRNKIVLITSSATADDLSAIGDHVFMMLPPNSQQGGDQAKFAVNKLQVKTAAILYRQNPYGLTLREGFGKQFASSGGKVVADVGFPDGEENFRDQLRQIQSASPQVVFIPVHDVDTGRILRQARELNFDKNIKFLGCDGSMSATTVEVGGEATEGAIFSNVASDSEAFANAYRVKYSGTPNPYAASAADTVKLVSSLIEEGARTSEDFQKRLVAHPGMEGATGITKFTQVQNSYWALSKKYRQFQVRRGQFELLP